LEFLKGFAFPFLEKVVLFVRNFGYFIDDSFRFEFLGVERFGFFIDRRITDGKDGFLGIRFVPGSLNGFVNEKAEHSRDKYSITFLYVKLCQINLITSLIILWHCNSL
jgi:hypothetical protein